MRTYTYTIPAGERVAINASGSTIAVQEATANFEIEIDDTYQFEAFQAFKFKSRVLFKKASLINTSGAPNTIKVWLGEGDVDDARMNLTGSIDANITNQPTVDIGNTPSVTVVGDVSEEVPNLKTPWASGTVLSGATGSFTAVSNRVALGIYNEGPGILFVKDSSSGSAKGVRVGPGQEKLIPGSGARYLYASGGDCTYYPFQLLRN